MHVWGFSMIEDLFACEFKVLQEVLHDIWMVARADTDDVSGAIVKAAFKFDFKGLTSESLCWNERLASYHSEFRCTANRRDGLLGILSYSFVIHFF